MKKNINENEMTSQEKMEFIQGANDCCEEIHQYGADAINRMYNALSNGTRQFTKAYLQGWAEMLHRYIDED